MTIDSESQINSSSSVNSELQKDLVKIMNEKEKSNSTKVRLCDTGDIDILQAEMPFGPESYHRQALQDQLDGKSRYLIAYQGDELVGHGNLLLNGPKESEVVEVLAGTPEISAVEIKPEFRSQGIGTEIITTAEQMARSLGKSQICIGVSEENPRARKLYEELGYSDTGLPKHIIHQDEKSLEGTYLVKDLTENR